MELSGIIHTIQILEKMIILGAVVQWRFVKFDFYALLHGSKKRAIFCPQKRGCILQARKLKKHESSLDSNTLFTQNEHFFDFRFINGIWVAHAVMAKSGQKNLCYLSLKQVIRN